MNPDNSENSASPKSTESPSVRSNKLILDKDGKPCRACNSSAAFASWAAGARKSSNLAHSSTNNSRQRSECPPDVETLGRSTWSLLHSITATYPLSPSPAQKSEVVQFLKLFAKLYPCWVCAEGFQAYMEKNHVRAGSRAELGKWMCEAHNDVNMKLGKNIFNCDKWEERWRTGWKDGTCD